MTPSAPVEILASCLYHAAHIALSPVQETPLDQMAMAAWSHEQLEDARTRERAGEKVLPRRVVERRPQAHECTVDSMFLQSWANTTLGYGGVGGQAGTLAYTVIIEGPSGERAVYWNTGLAYVFSYANATPQQRQSFEDDIRSRQTCPQYEAKRRYGARVSKEG